MLVVALQGEYYHSFLPFKGVLNFFMVRQQSKIDNMLSPLLLIMGYSPENFKHGGGGWVSI